MKKLIKLTVNEREIEVAVEPNMTLTDLLRYELGLTGTKKGCETGDCGACTVLLDDLPVNSCRYHAPGLSPENCHAALERRSEFHVRCAVSKVLLAGT